MMQRISLRVSIIFFAVLAFCRHSKKDYFNDSHRGTSEGIDGEKIKRIFVNYVYSPGADRTDSDLNLSFVLRHGFTVPLDPSVEVDYGITVNGECTSKLCQDPKESLIPNKYGQTPNVRVLQRENMGFDFGGHTAMLEELDREAKTGRYDAFIFLNDGVVGPFTPAYFPKKWHWAQAFTERMTDITDDRGEIGLVGTSIVCLPATDLGGAGPKVEGFAFAFSRHALEIVREHGTSFRQHGSKTAAILDGEYNLSKILFEHGLNIDSLLTAYNGVDWRTVTHCNSDVHPSRENNYFGASINPLEVIFHKPHWSGQPPVNEQITNLYKQFREEWVSASVKPELSMESEKE
jgi:hypothetical protein